MAKSEGNILTIASVVEKGFSPLAYRYLLLQSHYRTPTSFSWEALEASSKALSKLERLVSGLPDGGKINEEYKNKFVSKLENDFNTAQALAVVWTLAKDKSVSDEDKKATILDFDKVLGLGL
jgi:cysteinyl-tRNA synthetase